MLFHDAERELQLRDVMTGRTCAYVRTLASIARLCSHDHGPRRGIRMRRHAQLAITCTYLEHYTGGLLFHDAER